MKIPQILIQKNVALPILGFGTWLLRGRDCTRAVQTALEVGYRHIDTAHCYENHEAIKEAIHPYPREKLFITSKFELPQTDDQTVEQTCDKALLELGTNYLDLYLIHYPIRSYPIASIVHEMQKLVEKQKVRAIGVSNFTKRHLQDLIDQKLHVSVNQVEFHPYLYQKELLDFCRSHKIHLTSYRSLGKGALAADPVFEAIGNKYHKTPAQISLRWLIEQKISVIPKASSRKHMEENLDLLDFSLDAEDHKTLGHMKTQHRFCTGDWLDADYV
jgi:methylglyoxal/glyoxal reductase